MAIRIDGKKLIVFDVSTRRGHAQIYETPLKLDAGKHQIGISVHQRLLQSKGSSRQAGQKPMGRLFEVTGPLDATLPLSESHLRIIPRQPTPDSIQSDAKESWTGLQERFAGR